MKISHRYSYILCLDLEVASITFLKLPIFLSPSSALLLGKYQTLKWILKNILSHLMKMC